jgi:predicted ATPase
MHVQGFKCFHNNNFDLKPLTILSGRNASGKTSFLQVFALLHQTICECDNFEQLVLNGPVVKLGRVDDVLHKTKSKDSICFAIKTSSDTWERDYVASDRNNFKFERKSPIHGKDRLIEELFRSLTYLSADRLGPRETHSLDDAILYSDVGASGERAISRLISNEDLNVREELRISDTAPTLHKQIEAYMQKIFPGFHFDTRTVQGTNNAILSLAVNDGVGFVRPQNIGYGLSYTLPIYIACLSARKNNVILIENPEAHLHPQAQSQMGAFLAHVAASGVQIITETHSDHLLNGIRKSIKSKEHSINARDVGIFFFAGLNNDATPNIMSPTISDDGNLSEWPENFFDQYEKDLEYLVEW